MYCKNCGTQINDGAAFCEKCGTATSAAPTPVIPAETQKKQKKPLYKKWWFWLIVVFLVFMIVPTNAEDTPEKVPAEKTPEVIATTAAKEETKAEAKEEKVFTVGDTVEARNILVTLNDVSENIGSDFAAPETGNIFVLCEFTIENQSSEDIAVSSLLSFSGYFDDYAASVSLMAMVADSEKQQLDGTIAPGKKMRGVIGFEAPESWAQMEVRFQPSMLNDLEFIFTYEK